LFLLKDGLPGWISRDRCGRLYKNCVCRML